MRDFAITHQLLTQKCQIVYTNLCQISSSPEEEIEEYRDQMTHF